MRLDEIARAIDHRTAAEVWQRFRAGEQGVLGRHLYSLDGQATFDEINRRYDRDSDFRATVDRYIGDFERLLHEAETPTADAAKLYDLGDGSRLLSCWRMRADVCGRRALRVRLSSSL